MNNKLFAIAILLLAFGVNVNAQVVTDSLEEASSQQTDSVAAPLMVFEQPVFDLGQVSRSHDSVRTHVFRFKNMGNADLVILHAATGCGCTTPKYSKDPVKPGEWGEVEVTFDANMRPQGQTAKSVTLYYNGTTNYTRIYINVEIID